MDDILRQMIELYRDLDPRDIRDSEWHMSRETLETLDVSVPQGAIHALGINIRTDDNLPINTVQLITETNLDRAIRRAARDGCTVNVVKPVAMMPEVIRETPTLRALLRHWKGKVFRNG